MIKIDRLDIRVPGFSVRNFSLDVEDGEFFVLLGPTGSGKTLVLEALAGLTPAASGKIIIAGCNVTIVPPEARRVGVVYQDSALFPHLSVIKNITYGLRYQKAAGRPDDDYLDHIIDRLDIRPLLDRRIDRLSGGEKQRVALVRALATRPSLLLLDEPLSALDPAFREETRCLIKSLHQDLKMTFFMVTHDFAEALYLADRAAVIAGGRLLQTGKVLDIFRFPRTTFVAHFVGMKNLFPASFNGNKAQTETLSLTLDDSRLARKKRPTHVGIRPEDIRIGPPSGNGVGLNTFTGEISQLDAHGLYYELTVNVNQTPVRTIASGNQLLEIGTNPGQKVSVHIHPSRIHVIESVDDTLD